MTGERADRKAAAPMRLHIGAPRVLPPKTWTRSNLNAGLPRSTGPDATLWRGHYPRRAKLSPWLWPVAADLCFLATGPVRARSGKTSAASS